ncbi:patatin-like phospholipase family protein [Lutibacter holmesii]|uniref:Patatin-like phospholipase family protein n=1 Tax=Lutibacter holmesii TaxID=1137985 RepID=A0ABW3WN90_9FLAO
MKKLIYIFFLLFVSFSFSQQPAEKKDLKVGVVLSGGGAKGFAHIAVLKAIEDAGVRVDYIGGTSMGAIIGGLYASGYSASELDSIMKSINYETILSNDFPRKSKPFYEKEEGEKYAISLPIRKRSVGIPMAVTEGQNVLNLFTTLTQHVSNINDFTKLPIPFLCMATNLETGTQEVLNKGFLPIAMMASGSFPTLLAPVEIDGELYTDGGVVNNFPVDEVKAMGADVIIGVDIQNGLNDKEQLNSALKILNQIVGFQMYNTLNEKYKTVDVLVKPNLENYNVVSFDKMEEIMKIGEIAGQQNMNKFREIAQQQVKSKPHTIKKDIFKKFHISEIQISGNEDYTRAYILGKLNLKKRDSTNYKSLIESIENLSSTGNFELIQYKIDEIENGSAVKFKVKETEGENTVKFGIHYDNLYKTGVLVNFTAKHLLVKNDIFSGDLILGDNVRYNINYFIDNGFYWSFGMRFRYNNFNEDIRYEDSLINKLSIDYEDFTNQVYVQTVFGRKFALGGGAEFKRIIASSETTSELDGGKITANDEGKIYFDKSNYFNLFGYLKIDTYDKAYFPKEGLFFDASARFYLSSSDYLNTFEPFSQLKADFGMALTTFDSLTFQLFSKAGITVGENENRTLDYNVGGYGKNFINNFIPFYGYDFAELEGNGFLLSGLTARYEFVKKNYISLTANYARVSDDIFKDGKLFEDTKSGYMAGYGIETFIGPIEVNYAWSPDHKENYWYFNVGFWF